MKCLILKVVAGLRNKLLFVVNLLLLIFMLAYKGSGVEEEI